MVEQTTNGNDDDKKTVWRQVEARVSHAFFKIDSLPRRRCSRFPRRLSPRIQRLQVVIRAR